MAASPSSRLVALAWSAGSLLATVLLLRVTELTDDGVQTRRGSVLLRQAATRKVHVPSLVTSASQKAWPSAQVTVLSGNPFLSVVRFGSTSHSNAQLCGARSLAVHVPRPASVHATGGGAQGALATQPLARFDQRELTVNESGPIPRSARHVSSAQMSAFSSPLRSSNHPPLPTGAPSGSVTVSASSWDPTASKARPGSSCASTKQVNPPWLQG